MNNNDEVKSFIFHCIRQMFRVCKYKYSPEIIKKKEWYLKYSWSQKQKDSFKKWFIREFRKEFHYGKRKALEAFDYFDLMCGFQDS